MPDGFRFTKDVAQFSGFHKFWKNLPYNFIEKQASERESGLSMAYIAVRKVSDQIQNRVFNRPLAHHDVEVEHGLLNDRRIGVDLVLDAGVAESG